MERASSTGASRRTSQHAANGFSRRNGYGAAADTRFSLEKTKARVFKAFEDSAPAKFRSFFKSALMDRFLHTMVLYFVSKFQLMALARRKEQAGKEAGSAVPGKGKAPETLERELEGHTEELARIYATIIMTQSDYEHTQQDKFFFESLFEATNQILQEAFSEQRKGYELEEELGRIFRTDHFNIAKRRHEMKNPASGLSVRELYHLRHEDPEMNVRTLSSLYPKREGRGVSAAVSACSPVIATLLPNHKAAAHARPEKRTTAKNGAGGGGAGAAGGNAAGQDPQTDTLSQYEGSEME
mmetsp:Transcript_30676/g.99785  ORF Transcript_30676/g.99785 Transcript_30676/m.99785 type:complete len:298 (-) Transcript_30676:96-989(-)